MSPSRNEAFVSLRVPARTVRAAELAAAEAWEHGAAGVVEEGDEPDLALIVYAPLAAARALARALADAIDAPEPLAWELVEDIEWSEAWKEGFEAIRVSPRLVVRPPFAAPAPGPAALEVVIEPGQAFGTGSHASTRLALEAIDALYAGAPAGEGPVRVLDVGVGSGVLVAAALVLGGRSGLGFDLDALAAPAVRRCAVDNGLDDRLRVFTGPIEAIRDAEDFDLVAANLLKREVLPIVEPIAACTAADGRIVLSGLLERDIAEVLGRFGESGFSECERFTEPDDDGESWVAITLSRG